MSSTSFDPSQGPAQGSAEPEAGSLFQPPTASPQGAGAGGPEPAARGGKGRTVALVGGILAIVAVGAGGAFAFRQVGGGGAQPESVLPSTTIAFAKVDLDPSAGQKLDAIRFIRKFPDAQKDVKEDSDLRQVIIKGLQDDGALKGVDYAKDVEPWLGQRVGVGAIPGKTADAEPVVVVALAVTDEGKATASLPKIAEANGGECRLVEAYAVCTADGGVLADIVAATKKGNLADSASFQKDMGDLGERGVASAWVDAGKASELVAGLGPTSLLGITPSTGPVAKGRLAVAVRFDGPHLELAGHANGIPNNLKGPERAGSIADLPKGTLAAVTVANAGASVKTAWPELEKTFKTTLGEQELADGLAQLEDALGISVPDDLAAALGSQLSVAFGGMGEDQSDMRVAVVSNGDKAILQKLADRAGEGMGAGALTVRSAGDRTVVALSEGYADDLASGSGLGDTAAFKDSVQGADRALAAGFVDIAGVLTAFKDEIPADDASDLSGLSALGFTVSGEGDSADFSLRLSTK